MSYFFLLVSKNALSHKRRIIQDHTTNETFDQFKFNEIISSSRATHKNIYAAPEYTAQVIQNIASPFLKNFDLLSPVMIGGAKLLFVIASLLLVNNLVNPLSRNFVHICNYTQRLPLFIHFSNFNIPSYVHKWARRVRAPLPTVDKFQSHLLFYAQRLFLVSLSYITRPGPKRDSDAVDFLDTSRRDSTVPFTQYVEFEGFNCICESGRVVHAHDTSK